MGNSAGAFLAAFHICYHTPSVWASPLILLASIGAVSAHVPWWSILIQSLGGAVSALSLLLRMPTTAPGEPPINAFALPLSQSRFFLQWGSSVTGVLCYGLIYYIDMPTAHLIDPHHVLQPWVGPMAALSLALAVDACMHVARRLWNRNPQRTPPGRTVAFALCSALVVAVDICVHAEHWSAFLAPAVWLFLAMQVLLAPSYELST